MALCHLLAAPFEMYQIVICSDSKSALLSLTTGLNKNRPDIKYEINLMLHQLLQRGVSVTLQWIPSHAGILGNEYADKAARMGAANQPGAQPVLIKSSAIEEKIKIKRYINENYIKEKEKLGRHCPGVLAYRLPKTHALRAMHITNPLYNRLITNSWRARWSGPTCLCGEEFTPDHALLECYLFSRECAALRSASPNTTSLYPILEEADGNILDLLVAAINASPFQAMI